MRTVYFRTFEEGDLDEIYKWMNDDSLKQLSVGLNRRMSKEECRQWIAARMNHNPYQVWWAICSIEENKIIGYACLTDIHYINRTANFSGVVIGDKKHQDGFAWIETYLFILEYTFERLNMNRLYGSFLSEHRMSRLMSSSLFFNEEGIEHQAIFKNGYYHDLVLSALLATDYFLHKANNEYDYKKVIKRLLKNKKLKD